MRSRLDRRAWLTLANAILLLGLVYFGGVTLLQQVFTSAAGTQSPLAVVLSTLLMALLFTPLRRRVQAFIDRRFYRQKYNTEQAVAAFAAATRSEVEQKVLADRLASAAQESLQPESVSVWIRYETRVENRASRVDLPFSSPGSRLSPLAFRTWRINKNE